MADETKPRRLPRTRAVDRIAYLESLVSGRRVIHLGFAGEAGDWIDRMPANPRWLHARLASVAASIVGLDVDHVAVDRARAAGFAAHLADASDPASLSALGLEPAEVVVAGELIEHLEQPGVFLDAIHGLVAPGGRLVVTTPNAASILNPVAAVGRYELINPDHVAFYSWYTLANLLGRHDWSVREFVTYHFPYAPDAWRGSGAAALGRMAVRVQRALATWWPFVDFGLIAVAESRR